MSRYFTVRGHSLEEALDKINKKYGDRVRIISHKTVPSRGIRYLIGKEDMEVNGYILAGVEARSFDMTKDQVNKSAILASLGNKLQDQNLPREQRKNTDSPPDHEINQLLSEIREINQKLTIGVSTPPPESYPQLEKLGDVLKQNGISEDIISRIIEKLRNELTIGEIHDEQVVHNRTAQIIASELPVLEKDTLASKHNMVIVGPTGVGKTTTIAKLAALYGLTGRKKNIRIINIDSYRIGARSQIETYGEIMEIPVITVDTYDELKTQVALSSESELVLIDTIGNNPVNSDKLSEMKTLLSACGEDTEFHLAICAKTQLADLWNSMQNFGIFEFKSIILTKLDETTILGNCLSLLMESQIPLSYITDGQSVPVNIALGSPHSLLSRINGLQYNSELLKKTYPSLDITADWR